MEKNMKRRKEKERWNDRNTEGKKKNTRKKRKQGKGGKKEIWKEGRK